MREILEIFRCQTCGYETQNKKSFSNHVRYGCKLTQKNTETTCKYCNKELPERKPSEKGLFCNRRCYFLWKKGVLLGARKERVLISNYYYIMNPAHERANKKGYIPEHVAIMEELIGRHLNPEEIVHHIDHNSLNNNLDNLQLMTAHDHLSYHAKQKHLKSQGKVWRKE